MTLLNSVQNFSTKPFVEAYATCINHEEATIGESIQTRALFVVQLIVSLVALPIVLVLGLISLAVRAGQGEGKAAANELWHGLKEHLIVTIPTSIIGTVAPLTVTNEVGVNLMKCAVIDQNYLNRIEKALESNLIHAIRNRLDAEPLTMKSILKKTIIQATADALSEDTRMSMSTKAFAMHTVSKAFA